MRASSVPRPPQFTVTKANNFAIGSCTVNYNPTWSGYRGIGLGANLGLGLRSDTATINALYDEHTRCGNIAAVYHYCNAFGGYHVTCTGHCGYIHEYGKVF
jgi:hypothetical protein